MERKPGEHHMRAARFSAVEGDADIATVLASWRPKAKEDFTVTPPRLKPETAMDSEEQRISFVEDALKRALQHMYDSEARRSWPVPGMKAFGLAIMVEVFKMSSADIVADEGALSDLVEYLTEMIRATKEIDMRSSQFDPESAPDEDVQLVLRIRHTWELPDREFQPSFMSERVEWLKVDPAEGN